MQTYLTHRVQESGIHPGLMICSGRGSRPLVSRLASKKILPQHVAQSLRCLQQRCSSSSAAPSGGSSGGDAAELLLRLRTLHAFVEHRDSLREHYARAFLLSRPREPELHLPSVLLTPVHDASSGHAAKRRRKRRRT